jgi:hypothetical protein
VKRLRLALVMAGLLATPALAAQTRDDRALIEQGRTLRRAGRNAAALEAFREAYALSPTPEAAGQIGFAEHALEHWEPAWRFLRMALGAAADPWVVTQRRALEFSLQQVERHLGSLRVETTTPGATLSLDGQPAGALPMAEAARVGEGPVTVEIRAPGHQPDRREVTIAAGETVRLVVQLAPVEGPREAVGPRVEAPVGVRRSGPSPVVVRDAPPRESPPSSGGVTRALGWVSLGFAAVSLGGGVVAMVLRDGAAERWNDDSRCLAGSRTREQNCGDDRATVSTAHDLMVGGYVAGGVLAVGAMVLFLASPSAQERPSAPRLSVGIGPGSVALGGRF